MSELEDITSLLVEIRDTQKQALEQQALHLALAREQLDRARTQVEESLAVQREAVARQKAAMRIALPLILFCIAAIVYLIWRYL